MKRHIFWILGVVLVIFSFSLLFTRQSFASEEIMEGDTFFISGAVMDTHKEPVKEARIKVLANGQPQKIIVEHKMEEETETSSHGTYQLDSYVSTLRIYLSHY
jgi:hypothetical protein